MSSLAATQADGYYLPPEYYEAAQRNPKLTKNQWYHHRQKQQQNHRKQQQQPDKTTSITTTASSTNTSHPSTVRFELPYNALCQHCNAYISRGTRYNAIKRRVPEKKQNITANTGNDSLHSNNNKKKNDDEDDVVIWEFVMKCRTCHKQEFLLQTDPLHQQFRIIQGLQRLQRNDIAYAQQQEQQHDDKDKNDPVVALEKYRILQHEQSFVLPQLQKKRNELYQNDADQNALVRQQHRQKRKLYKEQTQLSQSYGWNPDRTRILLLHTMSKTCTQVHHIQAQETTYGTSIPWKQQQQWKRIRQSSIFSTCSKRNINNNNQQQKEEQVVVKKKQQQQQQRNQNHATTLCNERFLPDTVPSSHKTDIMKEPKHSIPVSISNGKQEQQHEEDTTYKPISGLDDLLMDYTSDSS